MPSLILIKSPGSSGPGQAYPLTAEVTVIGRDDTCGIVVPNHAVSRRHAQISRANGQYYVQDLNSRNHTYVNNNEVTAAHPLKNEDKIKICDFLFLFRDERAVTTARPQLPTEFTRAGDSGPDQSDQQVMDAANVEHTVSARSATELLEAQPSERIRALLDISVGLSKTLDLDVLLSQIADEMFNVFRQADRCFIIMTDEAERLLPKVVKARRSTPGDDHRFSKTIVRRCMKTLEAYLSEDASTDAALGAAQSIVEFRIRSVMCVPLAGSDGRAIGAMQLDTQDSKKKFREDDLKLLTIVANLASVAIEKAKLHQSLIEKERQQKEIELAKQVQLGFLPQTPPEITGYEFFSAYSAAQTVGGDYFDFIPLPDGRVAVVLGDVAGKGVPASLLMAKLSAEARYCMLTQSDAALAVNLLNEQLIRGGIGDRYVTLAAAVLNPADHRVTLVNAGHMYPMRFRVADGAFEQAISKDETGIPLGWMSGFEYASVEFGLDPGDNLILYTDGVTDAMNPVGVMFEMGGIRTALTDDTGSVPLVRPRAVGERILQAVRRHAAGRPQNDDIAVVCFGRLDPAHGPPTGLTDSRLQPHP